MRTTAGGELRFREAEPDDVALLRRWDEEPYIIEAKTDEDWGWELELVRTPAWREQLIAEVDGHPIGFVQIIDPALEETHYWGICPANLRAIDIWIGEPTYLGRGYGTQMMQLALERCFADPAVQAVLIDPLERNKKARHFFEQLGFELIEIRRFGDYTCAVYRLDRATWREPR